MKTVKQIFDETRKLAIKGSDFAWVPIKNDFYLSVNDSIKFWVLKIHGNQYRLLKTEKGYPCRFVDELMTLEDAIVYSDCEVNSIDLEKNYAKKSDEWRSHQATAKQKSALKKLNIKFHGKITAGNACDILNMQFGVRPYIDGNGIPISEREQKEVNKFVAKKKREQKTKQEKKYSKIFDIFTGEPVF